MRFTIARRIASLLLLFNLTGVLALLSVSWLMARRPAQDELRSAISHQKRITRRLRSDLNLLISEPTAFERIQTEIDEFNAGFPEIRSAAREETQGYIKTAAVMERLDYLETRWSAVQLELLNLLNDPVLADSNAFGWAKDDTSSIVEITENLSRSVTDAWIQQRNGRVLVVLLTALLANALLCLLYLCFARRSIIKPIHDLDRAVRSLANGQVQEVPVTSDDELGNLALAFNEMSRGMKASEDRYRLLFDSNPIPLFIFDKQSLGFLEVNKAAFEKYGYSREEFLTKTVTDIRPPEDVPAFLEFLRSGQAADATRICTHRKRDGSNFPVRVVVHDIVFELHQARLATIYDMSEHIRLEEQLRQAQKMEAIGRLSGGVAHDFNNLLTVISGNIALALEDGVHEKTRPRIDEIQKAADRASALTRQLLAFSRKQVMQLRIVNPNRVVKSAGEMLSRIISETIQVRMFLSPDVGIVRVDPAQIEQVILNLAVNARDAMPEGGVLTISTENVYLERHPKGDPDFTPGHYVRLSVEDSGCGMDEPTLKQIFDPFFTTKPAGKGTGLGLSMVYGIVKQSGGIITVDSQPGQGARFYIYLPAAQSITEQKDSVLEKPQVGSECILLVEDEAVVRDITAQALERLGYKVLSAGDVDTAQRLCAAHAEVDLLLTDVIMPRMNGATLARTLKNVRPEMRVLFMSGYTDDALSACELSEGAAHLIHKPFTVEELNWGVREVLDAVNIEV